MGWVLIPVSPPFFTIELEPRAPVTVHLTGRITLSNFSWRSVANHPIADPHHDFFFLSFTHIYLPASGQAVVTGVVPSPPRFFPSICIAHRVQQSHCSSIFHQVLLTHLLALSASRFVHKKKSPRIYTSIHSGGFELTKLTYTRLDDNLIRHRGDRHYNGTKAKDRIGTGGARSRE